MQEFLSCFAGIFDEFCESFLFRLLLSVIVVKVKF